MNSTRLIVCGLIVVAAFAWRAVGWHEKEHFTIVAHAGALLPGDVPTFFREGVPDAAAHCSIDSDLFKNKAVPHLTHAEFPEHFFDSEYLSGLEIPRLRFDYYKLCYANDIDPSEAGTLPWAIAEWTERLTIALAEHRARPDDPRIQQKCLVYAGILAHYAGDLCQPLHTTVHWDGRVAKVGDESPRTGIHAKVDGLLRQVPMTDEQITGDLQPLVYDDLWVAIMDELSRSHAAVDTVYDLEARLPAPRGEQSVTDEQLRAFALERMRASARFVASLYLTAWRDSADARLPKWDDRDALRIQ